MSKKTEAAAEVIELAGETETLAGAVTFKTYSDFIDYHTGNWSMLGQAMDAALAVKSRSEDLTDEADMVIEASAFSFLKDIDSLRGFFISAANIVEVSEEKFNFVAVD